MYPKQNIELVLKEALSIATTICETHFPFMSLVGLDK